MILKTHSFTLTGLELYERGAKAAIARELGVPPATVYRWIERKSVPPGYELAILEKVAHKKTLERLDDILPRYRALGEVVFRETLKVNPLLQKLAKESDDD